LTRASLTPALRTVDVFGFLKLGHRVIERSHQAVGSPELELCEPRGRRRTPEDIVQEFARLVQIRERIRRMRRV
jgi:hypothetical protein